MITITDTEIYKIQIKKIGTLYGKIEKINYDCEKKEFRLKFIDLDRGFSENISTLDIEKLEIADMGEYFLYNQKCTAEKVYNAYLSKYSLQECQAKNYTAEDIAKAKELKSMRYNWVARDENGELVAHTYKPEKYTHSWSDNSDWEYRLGKCSFQPVTWRDTEPTSLDDIIASENK